jgi:putative nucleotidyltransferase with HDIG domain
VIKLSLEHLQVNQKLARNIYDQDGRLLLARDILLEPRHIEQLLKKGFEEVYLWEETSAEEKTELDNRAAMRKAVLLPGIGTAVEAFREFMLSLSQGHAITLNQVEDTVDLIYPEIIGSNNILNQIKLLRQKDEYTMKHSVSVSIIAVKLGEGMGLNNKSLRCLAKAALLHDIGKARIPMDLINKPAQLTSQEHKEMQQHPLHGFRIAQEMQLTENEVITAILQHHEHFDGSGYPFKVLGHKLHIFSRIIAVADVFDALTSDRPYRKALPLFEALDEVVNRSLGHLDPFITRRLISYVLNVIPGEMVKLSDGSIASVVLVNQNEPQRPMIRVKDQFINLQEERRLHVIDLA